MNALTLVILFALTVIASAISVWRLILPKLHRERINRLNYWDNVKVNGKEGNYLYRNDTDHHVIKIGSENQRVHWRSIALTILVMLSLTGQCQFINLEWPRANVKHQNRDKELIFSAPDYLEYKIPNGYIAYEFTDKICTTAWICLDSIAGDSLIQSHDFKNWQPIAPNQWLYYAGYDEPVNVSADWFGGNVTFKYWLSKIK